MSLLTDIYIQNFKCYRRQQHFSLRQSNYFVGANNAGKSAILKAIHCFFDDSQYYAEFINKTELRSKGSGFNKTVIGVKFDLNEISTKTLKGKLKREYGDSLTLYKNFTFRENTNSIVVDYTLAGRTINIDDLDNNIKDFLSKISVSYIHPQEAADLLVKAQEKLKSRLLSNWGRNSAIKDALSELQVTWTDLRNKANIYLSSGLTSSLQDIWPGCATKVDLPERIEEIIGVSEIIFKGATDLPDVSLTSQGTGAQSTILYHTHFLLDSDKTLHRGFYHPVWLIEEPESFLHADIILKLGLLLASENWMKNIQMLISTHSPLLLASSKNDADNIMWSLIKDHNTHKSDVVSNWHDEDIKEIGILMGDSNFDVYFKTLSSKTAIIIEDNKEITQKKFIDAGIRVTQRLNGVTEMRRYFDVLRTVDSSLVNKIYLIVDNDDGIKEFNNVLGVGVIRKVTESGFKLISFGKNVYLIVFPEGYAVEELFYEHDGFLESCANQIFNQDYTAASTEKQIPPNLTRAHSHIRNKKVNGLEQAKKLIRNNQDVKDLFWEKVESRDLNFSTILADQILSLIQ